MTTELFVLQSLSIPLGNPDCLFQISRSYWDEFAYHEKEKTLISFQSKKERKFPPKAIFTQGCFMHLLNEMCCHVISCIGSLFTIDFPVSRILWLSCCQKRKVTKKDSSSSPLHLRDIPKCCPVVHILYCGLESVDD